MRPARFPALLSNASMKTVVSKLKRARLLAHLYWVALLTPCLLILSSSVEAGWAERAQILWAGTYTAQIIGTVAQPATAMGKTNRLGSSRKLETTTTVRGKLGTSFGFEYALIGGPAGAQAAIGSWSFCRSRACSIPCPENVRAANAGGLHPRFSAARRSSATSSRWIGRSYRVAGRSRSGRATASLASSYSAS